MAILIDRHSRIVVQGLTGSSGRRHGLLCRDYGSQVVAGVTPGKGGTHVEDIPVFDTVAEAVERCQADVTMILVPPQAAAEAILEADQAGVGLAVCITEGIPVRDMVLVNRALTDSAMRLIGPNCPGLITPDQCKVGILPGDIHRPGSIGVVSRSGTLTYEAVQQLSDAGLGQSTCVGIGGDPIIGTSFIDILALFNDDPDTEGVFLIGEIGGSAEEEAAAWIKQYMRKPVAAYIAGVTAPPGKRMGHAGAIVSGGSGRAEDKIASLRSSGVQVAGSPARMAEAMQDALRNAGIHGYDS
ncbi:succinyl-CoA synthetase, alpha subunit [Syntrophotalea carbinolica DSM 2380]|uniref:Succinate--CoA ligase [ADP-forming] subunit alpha n=1 Tax=Syntrophotalea carbinolica (strain DSM 2380 / NBRC 103641 / GraBd1) TaxID=338963 RepID=Q3A7Y5_SYNC1|nr:succinate--CoA ligase subunit alpha [Syntrophotalea carbinolica]ABA87507.1 succinyl-CoA synthetase, alpha subunit [Syntrophotalea carbinolica DSM 2380]